MLTMTWNAILATLGYLSSIWIFAEIVFFLLIAYVAKYSLNKLKTPPKYENCNVQTAMRIFKNLERMKTYDIKKFLSGWFCGASVESIRLDNLRSFLSWVMYAEFLKNLTPQQFDNVDTLIDYISTTHKMTFQPGHNPKVHHVHMTLEPLKYFHHPLVFYILVGIKNIFTDISLQALGYQKRYSRGVTYWYRPSSCPDDDILIPTVFFHGITTGWSIYSLLINQLSSQRSVFLFELDGIKIHSLNFELGSPDHYCDVIRRVLDRHHIQQINLVGHSFGTITVGWFIKRYPQYVSHLTLIDPVSLLLSQPEVAYNFLYRVPSNFIETVISYGAAKEITIAYALRRNFWWYQNELWLEDISPSIGVHVSLAGSDEVCNSKAVLEYLEICQRDRSKMKENENEEGRERGRERRRDIADITVCYRDGHSHAQVLMCNKSIGIMTQKILYGQKNVTGKGKQ